MNEDRRWEGAAYLRPKDEGSVLAFAGLYEFLPDPSPPRVIRTSGWPPVPPGLAADALEHTHDRTPVIVPEGLQSDWLDSKTTAKADVAGLLDALPDPKLVPVTVSNRVNLVRNSGPERIEPVVV